MPRMKSLVAIIGILPLVLIGCSSGDDAKQAAAGSSTASAQSAQAGAQAPGRKTPGPKSGDFCAHNHDPACGQGTYVGPHVAPKPTTGHWDGKGKPVNGGPVGADGSTGNGLTQEYCAKNEDPGCPGGSYVGPNAIPDPRGGHGYVKCEGTICTNPNHGGGESVGHWSPSGQAVNGGPAGADGSTGNNVTQEYCAKNQDPACPVGSYVGQQAIKNPDGSNSYVQCEGTICTNPNYGAGPEPEATEAPAAEPPTAEAPATEAPVATTTTAAPPEPGQTEEQGPDDGEN